MPISNTVHRLSDFTRAFCEEYMTGAYGKALASFSCPIIPTACPNWSSWAGRMCGIGSRSSRSWRILPPF